VIGDRVMAKNLLPFVLGVIAPLSGVSWLLLAH
jgi:hypothetical protein